MAHHLHPVLLGIPVALQANQAQLPCSRTSLCFPSQPPGQMAERSHLQPACLGRPPALHHRGLSFRRDMRNRACNKADEHFG